MSSTHHRRRQEDDFDFKPFFDLIVGMLFILLIMIAAQLFFAQWNKAVPELEQQKLAEVREAEITGLLTLLATRLQERGLPTSINRSMQTVTVGLPVATGVPSTLPRAQPPSVQGLATALEAVMVCATEAYSGTTACPRYDHVRLRALDLAVSAQGPGSSEAAAIFLAAQILDSAPGLTAILAPGGKPVMQAGVVRPGSDFAAISSAIPAANGAKDQTINLAITVNFAGR